MPAVARLIASLLALLGFAFTQSEPPLAVAWPSAADAGAAADAAASAWSERRSVAIADLASLPAEEICARLPDLVANPPPPEGTRVILEGRLPYPPEGEDDPDFRSFTYAAVRPGGALGVVQVDVRRDGEMWRAERVGFRATPAAGMRALLQTRAAAVAFTMLSLLAAFALARPSPLRRALAAGLVTARRHRRLVGVTMVLLYGVFGLGIGAGRVLPAGCDAAVLAVVTDAVTRVGATEAYGSGDVARAAAVTFYQNFFVVTFGVHFFLTLIGGLPSLLVAVPQFFVLGVPFGLLLDAPLAALPPLLVLIALELTAYFLVVAGGVIVFAALLRGGFRAYPAAVREAVTLLAPAGLLLLVGAWYEALLLITAGF